MLVVGVGRAMVVMVVGDNVGGNVSIKVGESVSSSTKSSETATVLLIVSSSTMLSSSTSASSNIVVALAFTVAVTLVLISGSIQ